MENFIIKQLEEKDWKELTSLIEKIADESNFFPFTSIDYNVDEKQQRDFIKNLNENKNCCIFGIFDREKIVATGYLYGGNRIRTYHSCTLGIGVLKDYQSKSLGNMLMKTLLDYAYQSDVIGKINVQVIKENTKAVNFYKKFGFKTEGIESRSLFIDGRFYDALNMGYILE